MKVYAVFFIGWEGSELLSLHATKEAAEIRAKIEQGKNYLYDDEIRVKELEVEE